MEFTYKALVLSIYDGDTMTLLIDTGFDIHTKQKVRLYGIDTPELRTRNKKEKALAKDVRDYLREMLQGKFVEINSREKGKYGRYLVDIYYNNMHINQHLIEKGYAKSYFGGKKNRWFNGT